MKKKRKIFESLRFNVFSFVYNVFLKFATPLESGEPKFLVLLFLMSKSFGHKQYIKWRKICLKKNILS